MTTLRKLGDILRTRSALSLERGLGLFLGMVLPLSCTLPKNGNNSAQSQVFLFESLSLTDYDTEKLTLKAIGQFNSREVTSLNTVDFYGNADCSGEKWGSGLHQDLKSKGLLLKVPQNKTSDIYVKTNTLTGCFFATNYVPDVTHPSEPKLLSTIPVSPSKVSSSPALMGTVTPLGSQLHFYDDEACSHPVGVGTGLEFTTVGIGVTLAAETTSTLYGTATDPLGKTSLCVMLGTYKHSTAAPPPPTYLSFTPTSPNHSSTHPVLIGNVTPEVAKVFLYKDSGCLNMLTEGTGADFTTTGLTFDVSANSTTTVYGKAADSDDYRSSCSYLGTYIHDTLPPDIPTYLSAAPVSPTRLTTFPRIKGSGSALAGDDTATIKLFNSMLCLNQIGGGTKSEFESTGILTNVAANSVTSIYAEAFDAAGNSSACVFFTNYIHTNIPPDPPVFGSTDPISPNNISITPLITGGFGYSFVPIVFVEFYKNETCTDLIGSGPSAAYTSTGIQLTVPTNSITTVYGVSTDQAGNRSACSVLSNYAYSNLPAPNPTFSMTIPASPSRTSFNPWIIGSAASTVAKIFLYSDNTCTTSFGSSSKLIFVSLGIQTTVPLNAKTDIYAKALDIYGNDSSCVYLTQYTHTNILPKVPIVGGTTPLSPNNYSYTPTLYGTIQTDPNAVLPPNLMRIYDSSLCLSQIGTGTTSLFTTSGVPLIVPSNATTLVYARSFDDAGNGSACTYMIDYTHDDLIPGNPLFVSTTPASPSYSEKVTVVGQIGITTDFLPPNEVRIYEDSACSSLLATGTPGDFVSSGIPLTVPLNTTTSIYAKIKNPAGTFTTCRKLTDFSHSNAGPSNVNASNQLNGSIKIAWSPDMTAWPTPTYLVQRSNAPGGPYSVLSWGTFANNFTDAGVEPGKTYYYVVAASNNTGTSLNSTETAITAFSPTPSQPINLVATAISDNVTLTWTGFASDYSFEVRRATQPGGPYTTISPRVFGTSYVNTGVANDTAYYYRVFGKNPAGRSVYSNEAQVLPLGISGAPPHLSLTILPKACSGGAPGVLLTWSNSNYATGYSLTSYNGVGGTSTFIPNLISGNQYLDCNFDNTYPAKNSYRLSSWWGPYKSASSNTVRFRGEPPPLLTAIAGNNSITLSWTGAFASAYIIQKATQAGGPYTTLSTNYPTSTYVDTNVVDGQSYFYIIQGDYGTEGLGFPSAEASAQPGPNPTGTPTLTLTIEPTLKTPYLAWSSVSPSNYYNIYRASNPGGPFAIAYFSNTTTFLDSSPASGMNYYYITAQWGGFESSPSNVVSYRSGIPLGLTLIPSTTNLKLNWTAVSGASTYSVYRSTQSRGPYTFLASAASNTYTDTTPTSGEGFFYVVQSVFSDATTSQFSAEVGGMLTTSSIPSGLTVTAYTGSSVTLKWAPVQNATKYKIYQATAPSASYSVVSQPTTNSGTVNSLIPLTKTYNFKVSAVIGTTEWPQSAPLTVISKNSPGTPSVSSMLGSIDVNWMGVSANTYNVLRSTDGVTFSTIASGLTATTYSDSSVVNGQVYYYQISATYSDLSTLTSPISLGVTTATIPPVPQGLAATTNNTGTDVDLSWSVVSGASTYNVYMSTTTGGPYGSPITSSATPVDVLVAGLTPDTPYYFVVTALSGNAESAISSEIRVIPQSPPPAPIATTSTTPSISLSWNAISGAVSYNLERSLDAITFTEITTGLVTTNYIDTTIQDYYMYSYRYVPVRGDGSTMVPSYPSTLHATGTQALPPHSLTANSPDSATIILKWVQVPNTFSYIVKRSNNPGGPYTTLANLSAAFNEYTDSSGSPGNTYYYVVTDTNQDGNESNNSNEVSVTLNNGVANLAALATQNTIALSWDPLSSVSSYRILRSEASGGPYGVIASGITGLSYTDTQIENSITYYYRAEGVYSGGILSTTSAEASATAAIQVNLQVPIELIDQGIASEVTPLIFERSRTSFEPQYYDGTLSYFFEVVATNADSSTKTIDLVDSNNVSIASLSIPMGTSYPTRFRTSFTTNPAVADNYRLALSATTSGSQLQVSSARILVTQVGATKTKLYIPLLASTGGSTSLDLTAPIETISATNYASLSNSLIYKRDPTRFAILPEFNAWELEVLAATTGISQGVVGLYNKSHNSIVTRTESIVTSNNISLIKSLFDEGVNSFNNTNNGDSIEVSGYCYRDCQTGSLQIYKAGLWVTLNSLNKGEVYYRLGLGEMNIMSTKAIESGRALLDTSVFSNPAVYFQSQVNIGSGGASSLNVELLSDATNDSDLSSLGAVVGSMLTFTSPTKTLLKTATPLTLTPNWRYLPQITPIGGSGNYNSSAVIIQFSAN